MSRSCSRQDFSRRAVSTAVTGLATTFTALFIMRLVLGAGESVAYPCYSLILARYFPEQHRGVANSLINAGSKLGPALGTLLGGLLIARIGWRALFVILGFGALIWLIPWMMWRPRKQTVSMALSGPIPRCRDSKQTIGMGHIFRPVLA